MKARLILGIAGLVLGITSYAGPGPDQNHQNHHKNHHDTALQNHGEHANKMGGHRSNQGHHSDSGHHGSHGKSVSGKPGRESDVNRTIEVEANDSMRFIHEPIKIKAGETIKFIVKNTGVIDHEFSIGTKGEHKAHGKMMMDNPGMHHGPGGSSITIAPGKSETLIWHFENAADVQAACNIPGHYQAGMHSNIQISN